MGSRVRSSTNSPKNMQDLFALYTYALMPTDTLTVLSTRDKTMGERDTRYLR
jgi:hypothetical protein